MYAQKGEVLSKLEGVEVFAFASIITTLASAVWRSVNAGGDLSDNGATHNKRLLLIGNIQQ
jgi:hypothetical protein